MSDTIKTAVLTSHLIDPELQRHPNLQAARLPKYNDARKEAVDYLRAKTTWNGGVDDAMDLTVSKGNGRGGNGRGGKGRGKGDKPKDVRFYCGKSSRRKSECRVFSHDKERKCVVPDKAGKYANKWVHPATGQRLKPDVKSGDINSLTTVPMVMGQFDDLEEDEYGYVLRSLARTRARRMLGAAVRHFTWATTSFFSTLARHARCARSRSSRRCRTSSRTRFPSTRRTAAG